MRCKIPANGMFRFITQPILEVMTSKVAQIEAIRELYRMV